MHGLLAFLKLFRRLYSLENLRRDVKLGLNPIEEKFLYRLIVIIQQRFKLRLMFDVQMFFHLKQNKIIKIL